MFFQYPHCLQKLSGVVSFKFKVAFINERVFTRMDK